MNEDKVKNLLKQVKYFNMFVSGIDEEDEDEVYAEVFPNCLIIQPLTAQAEREIKYNPYARILSSSKHFFCLQWFPKELDELIESELESDTKYKSRLNNLLKAKEQGKVELYSSITLPLKEFLKLNYEAKPFEKRKDRDYKDNMEDTSCKQLAKPPKTHEVIKRVSLTYNTFLILHNAKENKNKALFYYKNVQTFYTDCIINYILEHSNTRNNTVIIKFSTEYLQSFMNIIQRKNENIVNPSSFIKVPIFFVLEALSNKNFGVKGLKFLLWFLAFYRIKNPRIMHSLETIMLETGMFLGHGLKQPLRIMQKYFNYLFKVGALQIPQPLELNKDNIDTPPKYNKTFIKIQKPKKPKEKD